jgi:hypothetical protein
MMTDTDQINRLESCVTPMTTNLGWDETAARAPKAYTPTMLKIKSIK